MSRHISQIDNNNWIGDCVGPPGVLLLLIAKSHQEFCTNIDKCVWRMCVRYRSLNVVTRSFEFPIPRCSDSIEDLEDSYGNLFFISLDTRSFWLSSDLSEGIWPIKVGFLYTRRKNKCIVVMPFGSKNTPTFYITMMTILHDEWVILFNSKKYIVPSDTSVTEVF